MKYNNWFYIKYYLPTIVILCIMLGIVIHNLNIHAKVKKEYEENEILINRLNRVHRSDGNETTIFKNSISEETIKLNKTMDSTLILAMLSTLGIVAGIVFNPKLTIINRKLDDFKNDATNQYNELKTTVKELVTDKDLERSLRDVVDDVVEVTRGELTAFIVDEGSSFITFAKEISSGSFNLSAAQSITAKANKLICDSNKRAERLGPEFAKAHRDSQSKLTKIFTKGVEETLADELFNSKHKRFRMLCENFLHTHLTDAVRAYMYIKPQHNA